MYWYSSSRWNTSMMLTSASSSTLRARALQCRSVVLFMRTLQWAEAQVPSFDGPTTVSHHDAIEEGGHSGNGELVAAIDEVVDDGRLQIQQIELLVQSHGDDVVAVAERNLREVQDGAPDLALGEIDRRALTNVAGYQQTIATIQDGRRDQVETPRAPGPEIDLHPHGRSGREDRLLTLVTHEPDLLDGERALAGPTPLTRYTRRRRQRRLCAAQDADRQMAAYP